MGEAQGSLFEPEFNRAIKVQATDQRITSNAGALLLREADHRLGLVESLSRRIRDPRDPDCIRYDVCELLRERLYAMALGYQAQDDLDRLRLQREYGVDFVARRDAFARAFDRKCRGPVSEIDQLNACGLALRGTFGFPDADCPAESPLSEFDLAQAEPAPGPEAADPMTASPGEAGGGSGNAAAPLPPMPPSD